MRCPNDNVITSFWSLAFHCLKWVVVQFLKDCTVSTVPGKWLKFQMDEMVDGNLECFWPSKKARHKIQSACDPKEDWPTYHVKIIYETDNYDEAKSYEKTLSGEDSSDTFNEQKKIGCRKRKLVKNSDFVLGESSSDGEDDNNLPPLPKAPKLDNSKRTDLAMTLVTSEEIGNVDIIVDNNSSKTSSTMSPTEEMMADIDKIIMPPPSTARILRPIQEIQLDDNNQQDCCCIHVKRLNENVVALRTIVGELTSNVKKIISTPPQVEQINEFDTIPENSFGKYKYLMKYEDSLKNSQSARRQLETLFFIGGGDTVTDLMKRGLTRIFTNKLATKCSWYGRKDNYPLHKLLIISTLKDATRKRFPHLTDAEFEKIVATWFRQAALRYKRENDKSMIN